MPSTPWASSDSTAPATPAGSPSSVLTTRSAYPASRAARSMPMSREAGPYSAVPRVTTPIERVRPEARARAALFSR